MTRKRLGYSCLLLVFANLLSVYAQADNKKFELGAHFTLLRLREPQPILASAFQKFTTKVSGFGGRLTYNFTNKLALEAEANYFPKEHFLQADAQLQGLIGAKIGVHRKRFGVFGKVRPGFLRFAKLPLITDIQTIPCLPPNNCVLTITTISHTSGKTVFNLDVGGIAEFYPHRRAILRFDMGDTIIHYGKRPPGTLNLPFTKHNLQFSVGVGWRF